MATGQGRQAMYGHLVSTVLTQKQECLQYLTVDSDTYLQWRTLARGLELNTDCDVATFLLQHYEKTSDLQLTQCVKCAGSVVQYCVPCNIYMATQPSAANTLLQQEGTTLLQQEGATAADQAMLPGETILIDMETAEPQLTEEETQSQVVMVKADDLTEVDVSEVRGQEISSNQLEALVEACAMQGAIVTATTDATSSSLLPPPLTTTTTVTKSLLTPEMIERLKAQSVSTDSCKQTVGSLVTTEYQLVTSAEPITESSHCLLPQESQSNSQDASAVVVGGSECPPLLSVEDVPQGGAEASQQESAVECFSILSKSELSDEESDYYCEPLFKPEKTDDEDLQTAISVLESKVKVNAGGMTLSDALPGNEPSDKAATPDTVVGQSTGIEEADAGQLTKSVGTDVNADNEVEERSDPEEVDLTAGELDVTDNTEGESTLQKSHTDKSANADKEKSRTDGKSHATSELKSQATGSGSAAKKSGAGRKRKVEVESSDDEFTPESRTEMTSPSAVSHTMRTRYFDKKRPSFATPPSPAKSRDSDIQKEATSVRGKRGKRTKTENVESQPKVQNKRGKKVRVDDDEDDDAGAHLDDDVDDGKSKGKKKDGGNNPSKENSPVKKEVRLTKPNSATGKCVKLTEEQAPDLNSQVIVITGHEDLDKLLRPRITVHNQPSEMIKVEESGSPLVKLETNIAPLEFDPPEAKLASKVSIVTEGDELMIRRRKKRLTIKKEAKAYACDVCEEALGSRSELKRHLLQQHGSRPFACPHCPATYKNRSHLRVHLNRHAEVKPFQCPDCPKNFASNYALTAHRTTHSTARPEVCDICGRSFKSAKYLKGHRLLHESREKRFICQECGARFSRKSNLLNHIKIHNDDKQYECPHCHRRFIQSGSLKSHVFRMHNPNRSRPYVCDICGEARYAKDQFEKHMMIHTNTKPFKCEVCGAAFVQSNALKGHMKIHTETEGKSHWCSLCGAAFKKFASLKKHVRKIHPDYPEMSIATFEIIEVQLPGGEGVVTGAEVTEAELTESAEVMEVTE